VVNIDKFHNQVLNCIVTMVKCEAPIQ
jgi:hypothetical protein